MGDCLCKEPRNFRITSELYETQARIRCNDCGERYGTIAIREILKFPNDCKIIIVGGDSPHEFINIQELEEKEDLQENKELYSTISRTVSTTVRYNILKRQKWKCNICYKQLKFSEKHILGDEVAAIDHIHPFSKRDYYIHGSEKINELENLQALCLSCNLKKSDKTVQ